ncbi:MAG: hypothetical protein LAN71_01475 [Acidobacteriia bacterium]|nr:hypothetical protein [Terriglobia bacterium]
MHDILVCVPLIYCDHNFIVTAHQGPDVYKDHLRRLVATGAVTLVLSPTHWIEAAEDNDAARGIAKADFMDSLQTRWLHNRRSIQRREVSDAFFSFARIPSEAPQMIGDVRAVIADLAGEPAHRDSRAFVIHLHDIGDNHPLERNLRQAFETNQANKARFRAGAMTPAIVQNTERLYIEQLLPTETPSRVVIDADSKNRFLSACQMTDFPCLALEARATHDNWREERQLNRNNFMDQQHLMALPYVDFFITDDARLRTLIARISEGLPFPIATLLSKVEFDRRYP